MQRHRRGLAITHCDAVSLADTLRRWSEQPQTVAEMGARARQMLQEKFTRLALRRAAFPGSARLDVVVFWQRPRTFRGLTSSQH